MDASLLPLEFRGSVDRLLHHTRRPILRDTATVNGSYRHLAGALSGLFYRYEDYEDKLKTVFCEKLRLLYNNCLAVTFFDISLIESERCRSTKLE